MGISRGCIRMKRLSIQSIFFGRHIFFEGILPCNPLCKCKKENLPYNYKIQKKRFIRKEKCLSMRPSAEARFKFDPPYFGNILLRRDRTQILMIKLGSLSFERNPDSRVGNRILGRLPLFHAGQLYSTS